MGMMMPTAIEMIREHPITMATAILPMDSSLTAIKPADMMSSRMMGTAVMTILMVHPHTKNCTVRIRMIRRLSLTKRGWISRTSSSLRLLLPTAPCG